MLAVAQTAPAVRTRLKARHSEGDEARAIRRAAAHWANVQTWIPVVWGRRCLGHMKGDPYRGQVVFVPYSAAQGVPYNSYDQALNKMSSGFRFTTMSVKMIDSAIAVGNWYDTWGTECDPKAGDWSGTALTARVFTNSTQGAIYPGPAAGPFGLTKHLVRASAFSTESVARSLLLYDRVLAYDACTMTAGSQNMVNTLPATRYVTNGDPGLQIFIEADTVHNATAANLTVLTYKDNNGNTGHVVPTTPTLSKLVSIAAPTSTLGARAVIGGGTIATSQGAIYLTLAAGDQGVQSLTDFTWSASPTGTCSFVLQFPLALMPDASAAGVASDMEFVSGLDVVNKQIFDDACLSWMFFIPTATSNPSMIHGWMEFGAS